MFIKYKATLRQYSYSACQGGDSCCGPDNKCGEGEGDCDGNQDCMDGLVCGNNNCRYNSGYEWDSYDDCCEKQGNFISP